MDLSRYDGKHVRVTDKWGETFTGMAEYANHDFLECEYGGEEDGIFIEDCLNLGTDPAMYEYSGWNPYATPEMARETVLGFIDRYDDEQTYSWVMDIDDVIVGTIGAYDYNDDQIEIGFSVVPLWQGRGLATEALEKVLEYLTENEGIPCVTAWCAAENVGSRRVLEKAGMRLLSEEKGGLEVGGRVYDKLVYEHRS